jgi:hypothetical protein
MYNEAFTRAVLAERARDRQEALFLTSLDGYEPARSRACDGSALAFVRGLAAAVLRVVGVQPRRTIRNHVCCALADT